MSLLVVCDIEICHGVGHDIDPAAVAQEVMRCRDGGRRRRCLPAIRYAGESNLGGQPPAGTTGGPDTPDAVLECDFGEGLADGTNHAAVDRFVTVAVLAGFEKSQIVVLRASLAVVAAQDAATAPDQ